MTPITTLTYNYDFAKRLYRGNPAAFDEAWQGLIGMGEAFELVFDQAIAPVLQVIPEVTGFSWQDVHAVLPVYLVTDGENLFAPLCLVATSDVELMLHDLIWLLVRVNLATGFPNPEERDRTLQAITAAVAERAGLALPDALATAELRLREKHGIEYTPSAWDLTARTARSYLGIDN
ncbi:MAG: hypothetical protein WCV85_05720 [Patescibacteria group bacterium]